MFHNEWAAKYAENHGFTMVTDGNGVYYLTAQTDRGELGLRIESKMAALFKPNGTMKKRYDLTDGKFARWIEQTIKANSH